MRSLKRRSFLRYLAAGAGMAVVGTNSSLFAMESKRKFTMDLVCGAIGVKAKNQRDAIRLAAQGKFESVQPSPGELARMPADQLSELLSYLRESNLVWGAAGLSVDFRKDEATFKQGLAQLPTQAKALQQAGASRVSTWLSPAHGELTYLANFKQHTQRLREIAKILGDNGQRFGLEYVGPKTSWTKQRHSFIHSMAETKELLAAIDQDNVGLVLDSWHWYTAQETEADLLTLTNKDVVACDLNDAPVGLEVDQQLDLQRELPAATGVIDLKTFLSALIAIGYDGPVRAEPFNKPLRDMDNDDAIATTAKAMQKAFALVE